MRRPDWARTWPDPISHGTYRIEDTSAPFDSQAGFYIPDLDEAFNITHKEPATGVKDEQVKSS